MNLRTLKRLISPLLHTPLHPQWLANRRAGLAEALAGVRSGERVLDIGCLDGWARKRLAGGVHYVGLDYPETASGWYFTRPDLFGDAHALPIADGAFDVVLLLDVLEHLERPRQALGEAARVLAPGGRLIIMVPFLYPVHDAPRDFTRFTPAGLVSRAHEAGLAVASAHYQGTPLQTSALMMNLALANHMYRALSSPRAASLFWLVVAPLLPVVFAVLNLVGRLEEACVSDNDFMAFSLVAVLSKPHETDGPT